MTDVLQIPRRMMRHSMDVLLPDPSADYAGGHVARRRIDGVAFQGGRRLNGTGWSLADGASGRVYVDAANSVGAFEVPVGVRVELSGPDMPEPLAMEVKACTARCGPCGVHHWEVDVG